jgi:trehalose utilization protein
MAAKKINVVCWNEFIHEVTYDKVKKIYPKGMHKVIADSLNAQGDIKATLASLDQPEHGLTDKVLAAADVIIWWGHMAHDKVSDEVAAKVQKRVLEGMGAIFLHSAHFSKPFRKLMGTSCQLKWREAGEREVLWVTSPAHPIAEGIDDHFIVEHEEMYGEHFDIPEPMDTVFISSFTGGEVFRSGVTYKRGAGKVFYFRPGHETYPTYKNKNVLKVIANAVRWAAPTGKMELNCPNKPMGWWEPKKK